MPKDSVVRHKCDVPECVNPHHLEVGTQADNIADMWKRGRAADKRGLTFRRRPETIKSGPDHWNWNKRKKTCKNGHIFDEKNTVIGSDGHRRCRLCRNEMSRIRNNKLYSEDLAFREKKLSYSRSVREAKKQKIEERRYEHDPSD